jgi:hypothetical protein
MCLPCGKSGSGPTQLATLILVLMALIFAASFFVSTYKIGKTVTDDASRGQNATSTNTGAATPEGAAGINRSGGNGDVTN